MRMFQDLGCSKTKVIGEEWNQRNYSSHSKKKKNFLNISKHFLFNSKNKWAFLL
jgi:hypothetical protein